MPVKIKKVISYKLWVISLFIFLTHHSSLITSHFCFAAEPPRYDIEAKIDTVNHKIIAQQTITFTNNSDKELNEAYFHIYPHRQYSESEKRFLLRYAAYFNVNPYPEGFQSGDLKINSVTQTGKNLAYKIEGDDQTILKVELSERILPGSSVSMVLDFNVDIPHAYGRFGWHKNIVSLLRWYPMLSVLDDEGWHNYPFYPYHQPYFCEAGIYSVRLTVPKEEVVIHSGILKDEVSNIDATKTLIIQSELAIRDFGLAISPDFKVVSTQIGKVKINSYYLAADEFYAQKALEFSADLIEDYSRNLTPYPYREFNIACVYLGYGGTQSSNLILLDTRTYKLPRFLIRYFDFLVSHETGHQWFYNLVGSDEYQEMFIDEGINSYFILKHLEDKYGRDAKVMVLPKSIEWLIPNFSFSRAQLERYGFVAKNGLDRPVLGKLSSFKEPSSIFSITYGKGSKIIEMLNYVLGDAAFNRLMQRYFQEFSFKNIKVKDLRKLANKESGKDLHWFFDAWLNNTITCDYAVETVQDNRIYLESRGSIQMPVDIEVELETGEVLNYSWLDREKRKEIDVFGKAKVKSVSVDPENRILDLDRTNNHWRRKLDTRIVALYYPVYEVPVFLKDDAFSLVAGPSIGGSDLGIKVSLQKPQDNIVYISKAYNFNEQRIKSAIGFEQKHLSRKLLKWGVEAFDYNDIHGENDQEGLRLYLRRELWPFGYGLLDDNDHATLYLLRNRDFKSTLTVGGFEDIRNLYYRQQEEAILGLNLKFGRYGTYPDPAKGWKLNFILENAEHFLGGQNYFWRMSPELTRYFGISPRQKLAARVKLGLGLPSDKGLFQLGGERGLRGYGYKTVVGSQAVLFSGEYRFDMLENLNLRFGDNLACIDKIQGVGFLDIGKSWLRSFQDRDFKKDLGFGLRIHCNIIGFLEKLIFRIDIAKALNEPKEKPHIWLGISHAF